MAFRREVPPLEALLLKYVAKSGRYVGRIVSAEAVARAHRISKPAKSRTHRVKQELLRALLQSGRLSDDSLPDIFFHESMTRLEVIGAKISTVFVDRVRPYHHHYDHLLFDINFLSYFQVARLCPKLHTVNFSGCFRLTDDAVEALLRHCPGPSAYASCRANASARSLDWRGVCTADIKDLNLENCRKLTDVTLDHLRKLAPKLQVWESW